jgi:cell division protease FtsH
VKSYLKHVLIWMCTIVSMVAFFISVLPEHRQKDDLAYSDFLESVEKNLIQSVIFEEQHVTALTTDKKTWVTYIPYADPTLLSVLRQHHVHIHGKPPAQPSLLLHMFISWFPMMLFMGLWLVMLRQVHGGGKGPLSFGKNRAKPLVDREGKTTFADVAGIQEAKEELEEVVEFLKNTAVFRAIGARVPKGVLLVGSPGTGKTLLARAVSGEAKVPFFFISGSDFVEMFVGVGAARVRDLFESAKKNTPCIVFIDEIDAVGRHRGAGLGGGHDEREQTLNQLLVAMDGFEENEGVIVMAATNRPDVLDPALLRPGRFDRTIAINLPDVKGRTEILKTHLKKLKTDELNIDPIAKGTMGCSGAELANLVNEAGLYAARCKDTYVQNKHLLFAWEKLVMGGPERRSMVLGDDEKRRTAYHEAGHAIVGYCLAGHDPVYKVTIVPRGMALGLTAYLPEKEKHTQTTTMLEACITSLFGGRLAEELVYGSDHVSTGASNDLERATHLARNMVTRWGLSSMGPLVYDNDQNAVFLGKTFHQRTDMSDATAKGVDDAIRAIIERNYAKAKHILECRITSLHDMASALMTHETLDRQQIEEILGAPPFLES